MSHKDFNLKKRRGNRLWGRVQNWVTQLLPHYNLPKRVFTFKIHSFFVSYLCVAHALRLRHLVGKIRLLKACGTHALVHGGISAWWWVRWIEACLNQCFARFTGDHGLEFASSKSVDVTRFTGHKQQNLGSRQGGEFIGLGKRKKHWSTVCNSKNKCENYGSKWGLLYIIFTSYTHKSQ